MVRSAAEAMDMARAKVVKMQKPRARAVAALGPGIHPARIEMRADGAFRVRASTGELLRAELGEHFEDAFAEECMRERRTVLVTAGPAGDAVILGALQTSRAVARDAHDTLKIEGKRVEIEAEDGISIQVGKSTLRLDKHGAVKIVGQKMTMDVAAVVRVLSALVELP
jgi:hypothetical protein